MSCDSLCWQVLHDDKSQSSELEDLIELSRPKSDWKSAWNRTHSGIKQNRHQCTNWYYLFLWIHIDTAARKSGWSAQATVNQLTCDHPKLFTHINKGTIQKWIDKETKRGWSAATKKNVAVRATLLT
jgi:hypothetical protein